MIGIARGRRPWGLLGMLGLIALVEAIVAAHPIAFTADAVRLDWARTGRAARGAEVRRSGVLCFGDSLVKHGVYPRVLGAALGRPAYNLALPAGPAPASYFLLRRALDAGARPRALVVDFHPALLLSRPSLTADYWPELLTARELVELSWVARDARLFAALALGKVLPTVKDRQALRARVLGALRGATWPGDELYPALLRNWSVNRGALVPSRHQAPAVDTEGEVASHAGRPAWWVTDRATIVYVRKFLDLAAAEGLPVFWLIPPTSPEHQARAERNGRDARFAAFVRDMQARYANVVVIDGRHAGYPRSAFFDKTHLDRRGASAFSAALGSILGPSLAGSGQATAPAGRRIDLPPYRLPPVEIPLEDVDRSLLAVKAEGGRVAR